MIRTIEPCKVFAEWMAEVRTKSYPVLRAFSFITNVDGETDLQLCVFLSTAQVSCNNTKFRSEWSYILNHILLHENTHSSLNWLNLCKRMQSIQTTMNQCIMNYFSKNIKNETKCITDRKHIYNWSRPVVSETYMQFRAFCPHPVSFLQRGG